MQNVAIDRLATSAGWPPQKEAARVQKQEPQAEVSKQANSIPSEPVPTTGMEVRFANLARRFAEFNHSLLSLPDGQLLLSSTVFGGITRLLPDARAALLLLKQWEGQ
jgi:hypothetical protein